MKQEAIFTGKDKMQIWSASLMCLLSYTIQFIPMFLIALSFDAFMRPLNGESIDYARFVMLSGAGLLYTGLLYLVQAVQYKMTYVPGYAIASDLRERLANKIRNLPLSYFDRKGSSDLTAILLDEVGAFEYALALILPQMFGALGAIILSLGFLVWYNPTLSLATAVFFPAAIVVLLISKLVQDRKLKTIISKKLSSYAKEQEFLDMIKELTVYNFTGSYIKELEISLASVTKAETETETTTGALFSSAQAIIKFGIAAVILIGAMLLAKDNINVLTYFLFLVIISRLYDPIAVFFLQLAQVFAVKTQLEKIKTLQTEPEQGGETNFTPKSLDIEFHNVKFSYGYKQVFDHLSFTVREGTVTAFTGKSGSGKTTAAKLAARFYDPESGMITLGGSDISKVHPETLMPYYAFVFQDVLLFDDTVMENIRLGRPNATDEEVLEVAQLMMCNEFVKQLPDGYNTRIGENGSRLSGGERQRISIARAMIKNAPIILLDEATASLDAENERAVQLALSRLIQGKTLIVIAHRLRTIENADQIIVI